LLAAPFRYGHTRSSRFRRAVEKPGIFYASERERKAIAETAYWRLRFFSRSPGFTPPSTTSEHTSFSVKVGTEKALDPAASGSASASARLAEHPFKCRLLGVGVLTRLAQFREMRGRAMAHAFMELIRRCKATGRLARSIPDDFLAWELTWRLQLFGLHQPQIVARGCKSEAALDAHAAMHSISLGLPVPDPASI
jgi:hypothetical protein